MVFNKHLDYTVPKAFGTKIATMGLGDRLGLASPAHIRVVQDRNVKPILAQQSKRELNLTGRNYRGVLDDVCFAVMQEGYKGGFGADGDHLKEEADIKEAIVIGYSMITLDCSEQIDGGVSDETAYDKYKALPADVRNYYEEYYLNKDVAVGDSAISFDKLTLAKEVLLYHEVINFIAYINENYIQKAKQTIDFEISLDETEYPTTWTGHFLVASELQRRDIDITSMAPRFVGEFQKGIDYIGNLDEFEQNMKIHAHIADHFGYKLSIHSGSVKFSMFELIGKYTGKRLHIKTAGTNWLEAIKVIILSNPDLYRRMLQCSQQHFDEARAYYHVDADPKLIMGTDAVDDDSLISYMDEKNARQLLHITYGILLNIEEDGPCLYKNEIYTTLIQNEELYYQHLMQHIGKHLDSLGIRAEQ